LALLVAFRDPPDGIPFGSLPAIGSAVLNALLYIILRRVLVSGERTEPFLPSVRPLFTIWQRRETW